jgi:hypothetical protein
MQTRFFGMAGGVDQVTPPIAIPPGRLASCLNYESSPRGYRRIDGWERFDGRSKPSEATYQVVLFEQGKMQAPVGAVITGEASGKTAMVLHEGSVYAGSFADGNATGAFPVINNTGLLNGERLFFGPVELGTVAGDIFANTPTSLEEERAWATAAQEERRTHIMAVPGSGPVRGVWTYLGDVYAVRDAADGLSGALHKATSTGWTAVPLFHSLSFDAGTAAFQVGETVTTTAPDGTGLVKKVVLQDGDWTTNDAVGRLIITDITGTFGNDRPITSPLGAAVINGTSTAITLPPGGRYSFDNHNFLATTGTLSMYAANGVGNAFEFDGTTLTPIITGEPDDTPVRVVIHRDHLFLGYRNGRVLHSAIFSPLNYEVIQGALLAGIGDEITDLVPTATGELAIFGRNKVAILYGTNASNWNLVTLTDESGAAPWTTQLIGAPLYLDKIGIRSLETTQAYGNFSLGTKTQLIERHFRNKRLAGISAVASLRIRGKDAYRVFFADGTGVTIYFGRKMQECTFFDLGFAVTCAVSGTDTGFNEVLFVGDSAGMVYQLDKGNSGDGEIISAHMRLPFNHVGSPSQEKRWHKAAIEVDGSSQTQMAITNSMSYGDIELPESYEQQFIVHGGGGLWNEAIWNTFHWSSNVEGTADIFLEGIGKNVSLILISDDDYSVPHTITGVTLFFNFRRVAL